MRIQVVCGSLERTERVLDLLGQTHQLVPTPNADRVHDVDAVVAVWPETPQGRTKAARLVAPLEPESSLAILPAGFTADRLGVANAGVRYLVDPYHPMELIRQVGAMVGSLNDVGPILWAGDTMVDEGARMATRSGHDLQLTRREFDLLLHLVGHLGQVQERGTLLHAVWASTDYNPNVIEVTVSTLRQKLEAHGPRILHTVRGIGYVCRVDDADSSDQVIVVNPPETSVRDRHRPMERRKALAEEAVSLQTVEVPAPWT